MTRKIFYGWVVLGAGFAIIGMGIGTLFSLGVFLKPIVEAMGWNRGAISSVAFLSWIIAGLGSFIWGILSDRIGTRAVVLSGGVLLGLGLVLSSQIVALWQFYFTFGFMVGMGMSAFYVPLSTVATKWFTARRGLAVAIISGGNGFGTLLVAPLSRWLISTFDWRMALLVLGDLVWFVVIPAGLLIRNHPGEVGTAAYGERTPGQTRPERHSHPRMGSRDALKSLPFWTISITHFACCIAHSGAILHMVAHATDQGISAMAAATVLGVSGFAAMLGRLVTGMLADRFGAKPILVVSLGFQAIMVLLFLFAKDLGTFYPLAFFFGMSYGGVMPLYALVTREYFGARVMGTAYGGVFFISSIGMGVGSYAGGIIFDHFRSYQWLYLSAFAIGLVSVALAATLRPPRSAAGEMIAPALH